MEIWVKLTPGQGDEVWLVKLDGDGAFAERFVLKSLPLGETRWLSRSTSRGG